MKDALVLDGGLATELERHGANLAHPLWSARVLLENPGLIRRVHEDYFRAGADVVTTATYQASVAGFAREGLSETEAIGLMRLSVELAREARDRVSPGGLVAGSIGPYGAALADGSEYRGHYGVDPAFLAGFHRPRLEALLAAGADLLAIETIPSPVEARVIVDLLDHWPDARAWVSYSCRDDAHVSEGQGIEAAAAALGPSPQVIAVGVNCVAPRFVDGLLARLQGATDRPLVVYPNSGETWDAMNRRWVGQPDTFDPGRDVPRWLAAGARYVGGCCRTTPETIAAIRSTVHRDSE